ncbi:class I SAM-dependent methyltransferase [Marinobacter sp. SS21]|uniref:class I SAM-dependent methyltransferase n=1 Tax=Marinobacter sp. SS21 TaxID=2979460 RepID=UPI00232D2F31|nr:class I SAM-dependent methyltransferase [Marinobacter sp. SS21]MDC0662118.1 class I SAM-dependent methyltransferase [Marinobacter sp. SS21]
MSSMLNSHAALLKNRELLQGRLVLVGLQDSAILGQLPEGGHVVTEHYGVYRSLPAAGPWSPLFGYFDDSNPYGNADTVVVFMPKAKAELGLRLRLAGALLAPSGRLVLVGEKREGVASAVKQLQSLADSTAKVDSARHCQVWLAERMVSQAPLTVADWLTWHSVEVAGVSVEVAGLPGIFSDGRLDEGTRLLLQSLADEPVAGPVLDFACGAGVIGSWLHQWATPRGLAFTVDGIDVQAQAVACAWQSYQRAGAQGQIEPGDGLAGAGRQYATLVTNPPFHRGVRTDTSMTERFLAEAARHLQSGGELRLVANSFLPYERLIRQFVGPCRILAQDNRFTVYSAKRL